jgi:hypothetical protein
MPKKEIDYSNTIIYKISCKDTNINDVYIGHTTNFVQRKYAHKQGCINDKNANYTCKLYEVIRKNGGWCNWKMEIIALINCRDHYEARKKEQEYFITLKATLNSIEPMPKEKIIENIENIENNEKIKGNKLVTNKSPNSIVTNFTCECCDYICSKNSEYIKHLLTQKHIGNISGNAKISLSKMQIHTCKFCNKIYKSRKGLWSHNKLCNKSIEPNIEIKVLTDLVLELVKSNNTLQKQMIDVCKNIQPSNIITNSNNNNKTFNLQVFLNEECKDAMNITDFMNSFQLQIKDLEKVGKLGYVDGITDIIVQKLKELDIKQRPMHCSDSKRETIYIKDEGIWEKEGPANNKVKKVVGHVSKHNLNLLNSWKDLHPCCLNSNSPHNEHYLHLIKESLGGPEDMDLTESKIVKKISKEIIIDKK